MGYLVMTSVADVVSKVAGTAACKARVREAKPRPLSEKNRKM
jgi:hypothetical protein